MSCIVVGVLKAGVLTRVYTTTGYVRSTTGTGTTYRVVGLVESAVRYVHSHGTQTVRIPGNTAEGGVPVLVVRTYRYRKWGRRRLRSLSQPARWRGCCAFVTPYAYRYGTVPYNTALYVLYWYRGSTGIWCITSVLSPLEIFVSAGQAWTWLL